MEARCLAISDSFDAMAFDRPYRASLSVSSALGEIEDNIGTQFDPLTANLFIKLVSDGTINLKLSSKIESAC